MEDTEPLPDRFKAVELPDPRFALEDGDARDESSEEFPLRMVPLGVLCLERGSLGPDESKLCCSEPVPLLLVPLEF